MMIGPILGVTPVWNGPYSGQGTGPVTPTNPDGPDIPDPGTTTPQTFSLQDGPVTFVVRASATGQYADGSWWALSTQGQPVEVVEIQPVSQTLATRRLSDNRVIQNSVVHGTMLNPGNAAQGFPTANVSTLAARQAVNFFGELQGYDSFTGLTAAGGAVTNLAWNAGANVDPGFTGKTLSLSRGTLAKGVSTVDGVHSQARPALNDMRFLTVVDQRPAVGAFRPGIALADKTSVVTDSQLDLSVLPQLSATGIALPTFASIDNGLLVGNSWQHTYNVLSRNIVPAGNKGAYAGDFTPLIPEAILAMCLGAFTVDQRRILARRIVQYAIDIAARAHEGGVIIDNGGHCHGRRLSLILAWKLTGVQYFRDAAGLVAAGKNYPAGGIPVGVTVYGDDLQFAYLTQKHINELQDKIFPYPQSMLGWPEWVQEATTGNYPDTAVGTNWQNFWPNTPAQIDAAAKAYSAAKGLLDAKGEPRDHDLKEAYRTITAKTFLPGALLMHLLGLRAAWNNEAYFDYSDRHMADVIAGADQYSNRVSPWVVQAWQAHRGANVWKAPSNGGTNPTPNPPNKVQITSVPAQSWDTTGDSAFYSGKFIVPMLTTVDLDYAELAIENVQVDGAGTLQARIDDVERGGAGTAWVDLGVAQAGTPFSGVLRMPETSYWGRLQLRVKENPDSVHTYPTMQIASGYYVHCEGQSDLHAPWTDFRGAPGDVPDVVTHPGDHVFSYTRRDFNAGVMVNAVWSGDKTLHAVGKVLANDFSARKPGCKLVFIVTAKAGTAPSYMRDANETEGNNTTTRSFAVDDEAVRLGTFGRRVRTVASLFYYSSALDANNYEFYKDVTLFVAGLTPEGENGIPDATGKLVRSSAEWFDWSTSRLANTSNFYGSTFNIDKQIGWRAGLEVNTVFTNLVVKRPWTAMPHAQYGYWTDTAQTIWQVDNHATPVGRMGGNYRDGALRQTRGTLQVLMQAHGLLPVKTCKLDRIKLAADRKSISIASSDAPAITTVWKLRGGTPPRPGLEVGGFAVDGQFIDRSALIDNKIVLYPPAGQDSFSEHPMVAAIGNRLIPDGEAVTQAWHVMGWAAQPISPDPALILEGHPFDLLDIPWATGPHRQMLGNTVYRAPANLPAGVTSVIGEFRGRIEQNDRLSDALLAHESYWNIRIAAAKGGVASVQLQLDDVNDALRSYSFGMDVDVRKLRHLRFGIDLSAQKAWVLAGGKYFETSLLVDSSGQAVVPVKQFAGGRRLLAFGKTTTSDRVRGEVESLEVWLNQPSVSGGRPAATPDHVFSDANTAFASTGWTLSGTDPVRSQSDLMLLD